jgi:hypothetical protein
MAQDWDLLLRRWRDISGASRCYGIHHRLARHRVIWSQGCRNTETRKENNTGNEVTGIVDKCWSTGMPMILTSGICNISWSNRNSTRQLEVHSNIHSCGYRGQYGCPRLWCWSLIGKGFRVMSLPPRTYRFTCLRVIYLLNTRQGVRKKVTEKVSDTLEKFRRENTRIVLV